MSDEEHALPRAVQLQVDAGRALGLRHELLDHEHKLLFRLHGPDRSLTLLGAQSPLNGAVPARIAQDKHYTSLVLAARGIRVPRTVRCLKPGFFEDPLYARDAGPEPGLAFAAAHGYPVVAKPNRRSQGRDVVVVDDEPSLASTIRRIWEGDYIALVQEPIAGPDVRIDMLDGELLVGYEREPVVVTGDGRSTLEALIEAADERFCQPAFRARALGGKAWRRAVIDRGHALGDVLPAGVRVGLSEGVLNLNQLARARLIAALPARWRDHLRLIADAVGLRHLGVDFRGAALADDPRDATVLEVNASPLLLGIAELGHRELALEAQTRVLRAAFDL